MRINKMEALQDFISDYALELEFLKHKGIILLTDENSAMDEIEYKGLYDEFIDYALEQYSNYKEEIQNFRYNRLLERLK